ncbi:hypothetical protein GOODEAATRI_005387, partial [Goodea atripinnis]
VSRVAVCTLGDLYTHLQRLMDQELEGTVKALLQKAGESNTFIRQDVDAALDCMVQHCTPTRSIGALLTGGISHLNPVVRKCSAQHLANLLEKVGAARLLSGGKDLTERILPAITKLAQDSSQEARESNSNYSCKYQTQSIADKTEYVKQISGLLGSKDFRERIKGIDQLVADCEHNPKMVVNSMFPVFDAFKARLQESNSKVNLYALESLPKIIQLLKDSLSQVVNILVPAIVDNHLNSKNNAIYYAAIGATNALMVEQKVLPLLWHLLGTSTHSGSIHGRGGSVRSATAQLCLALHTQMGSSLIEYAATQPANVQKGLNELLKTLK